MRQLRIICYIWACICAICMHIFAYEHVYTTRTSARLFMFTQSKCHITIVLNWSTFLMVKSLEIGSEEHAQLNEMIFTLIIVCKYRDYLVLRECEDTNARLTLCSQLKRGCTVSRAPQARAKKILRISYIIQFLYFALVLQSHNKYFKHEDTVNVHSLKNWKYFTLNTTFSRTPLSKRAMCVF